MQSDYYKYFTNLHRMIDIGSGAAKFTKASIYHLLSTVKFTGFISLSIRGYKNVQNYQYYMWTFTKAYICPKNVPKKW